MTGGVTHQGGRQFVVVGEKRRHLGAERHARGPGQGREIGDQLRLVLIGERERIGEDETTLCVGIADLDRNALAA